MITWKMFLKQILKMFSYKNIYGLSTGNMLVDDKNILEKIFEKSKMLIAVHCEDETIIQNNTKHFQSIYGEEIPIKFHPEIRSVEACYTSSSMAIDLAKKHNTRLHVFHLSTKKELDLFTNDIPLKEKKITAEVCIHHLYFDDSHYDEKGTHIKWNPAIKSKADKEALLQALLDDRIDVIATDHAPHTLDEKNNNYSKAPSGGPLVQHALVAMLEFYHERKISLEKIVEKMCHSPAICFQVENRGFLREGYAADLVLFELNNPWTVTKDNILYKCGWSPFEGNTFKSRVSHTWVNGHLVYQNGKFDESQKGQRLTFNR